MLPFLNNKKQNTASLMLRRVIQTKSRKKGAKKKDELKEEGVNLSVEERPSDIMEVKVGKK